VCVCVCGKSVVEPWLYMCVCLSVCVCGGAMVVCVWVCGKSVVEQWSSLILPISIVFLLVLVYDYYIDAACTAHLDTTRTGQLGTIFILASALLLSAVWNHPFVERMASMLDMSQLTSSEHQVSGGVVVGAIMFAVGMSCCLCLVMNYIYYYIYYELYFHYISAVN